MNETVYTLEPSESRIQQIITKNWVSNANIYIKI